MYANGLVPGLIKTEVIPRKEQAVRSPSKLSSILGKKWLEDFDMSQLKYGFTAIKFAELKYLAFI